MFLNNRCLTVRSIVEYSWYIIDELPLSMSFLEFNRHHSTTIYGIPTFPFGVPFGFQIPKYRSSHVLLSDRWLSQS